MNEFFQIVFGSAILAIIFISLVLYFIWNYIRSAVASGTEYGIERAIENIMEKYNLEIRADENDRIYLAQSKTIHIKKDKHDS